MTDAIALASAGPLAVPRLSDPPKGLGARRTAACVRALCLIAGDAALRGLATFSRDRRVTVTRELVRGWDRFDSEEYAKVVLADSSLDDGRLVLTEPAP